MNVAAKIDSRAVISDRARLAAEQAISSQLLDITSDGARGILINVTRGEIVRGEDALAADLELRLGPGLHLHDSPADDEEEL